MPFLENYFLVPVKIKNVPILSCDNFTLGLYLCGINESISKNKNTHTLGCKCKGVHMHVYDFVTCLLIIHNAQGSVYSPLWTSEEGILSSHKKQNASLSVDQCYSACVYVYAQILKS